MVLDFRAAWNEISNIIVTTISLILLNDISPITLVISTEIKDAKDHEKAAARANV